MQIKNNQIIKLSYSILVGIIIGMKIYKSNNLVTISRYRFGTRNNVKILHISDLHNKAFGRNQCYIRRVVLDEKPDVIFITGDLVHNKQNSSAKRLIQVLSRLGPIYFVPGNHEYMAGNYDEFGEWLLDHNVCVLQNKLVKTTIKDCILKIYGLDDPMALGHKKMYACDIKRALEVLDSKAINVENSVKILLVHRPELLDIYSEYEFDFVFSGHAHGGQFRIPFLGGFIAPNQGLFPKYSEGVLSQNNTVEIISRGLGNSVIPLRINNHPEIVVVTI